jgi:hypothetical protein
MIKKTLSIAGLVLTIGAAMVLGQPARDSLHNPRAAQRQNAPISLYDIPPRYLIDMPTAGTLPRGYFDIGLRVYSGGGAVGFTDIGLSNRLQLGLSYGADQALSNQDPLWNPNIQFSAKFRIVDEMQYFPAVTIGYSSQGDGAWSKPQQRFTYKSRGFYLVASRSFYFYRWTSGWHGGFNSSREHKVDNDNQVNFFFGFDATFNYNFAFLAEYDLALNDDRSDAPPGLTPFSGKGRGYLNTSVKWLFTDNLELELLFKDLLTNRRESSTFTRGLRLTYVDHF